MFRYAAVRAHWSLLAVICLASLLNAAEDGTSQKHTLRYRFAEASTLHYVVGDDTSIYIQVGATAEVIQHASESGRVLRPVTIDPDGAAVLEITNEYVDLSAGNGAISWDSRSGEQAPAEFAGIEKTIGIPLMNVTVAPNGKIVAATSGDDVADPSLLESTRFDLLPMLPEQPVAVGESWTQRYEVDVTTNLKLKKKIAMQREYTLRSVDNGIAEIDVRTAVLTPIQDPREEGQLIKRTPSGSFRLDMAQGRLLERIMKLDNKVVGFEGPHTALRVVGTRQESLGSEEKAAARPQPNRVK